MAQTLPFHSVRPGTPHVFHNSDACEAGRLIEGADWRPGDGDRRLCEACTRLNARAGRQRAAAPGSGEHARWRAVRRGRGEARRVMARCPRTGQTVWTGLSMTRALLQQLAGSNFSLWCPACRTHHSWAGTTAWIGGDGEEGGDARALHR